MADTPTTDPPIPESRRDLADHQADGSFQARTLSRDDQAGTLPKKPVAEAIGKFTGDVSATGKATASPHTDANTVRIEADWVTMSADVALKPGVEPDPPHFFIGWVQSLQSSRRVGTYKTAAGDTFSRAIAAETPQSDRRPYVDNKTGIRSKVAAPWYELPEELGTQHRQVHVTAFDKPAFSLDATLKGKDDPFKGAQLVGVSGSDTFLTSLKAGDHGEVTLKTWHWEVPWEMNVEGITAAGATGKAATSGTSTAANPNLDGKIATDAGAKARDTYDSVGAAATKLAADFAGFVGELPWHRDNAKDSYANMVAALWKSDAKINVELLENGKALKNKDLDGLDVSLAANGSFSANRPANGQTFWLLARMVLDPGKMDTALDITVNGVKGHTIAAPYASGNGKPVDVTIVHPHWFDATRTITVSAWIG